MAAMPEEIYVIGSGPNGLSAAIALARAGREVIVLEARDQVGGGVRSAELTLPGFIHDVCSAIYPLAAGSPWFHRLPLGKHGLAWIHPPKPLAHPLDGGEAVVLDRSLEVTARDLGEDGPSYARLVKPLVLRWETLSREVLSPAHLPRHPILLARFGLRAILSGRGLAEKYFKGPRARALFAGLAAHSILPLSERVSAAYALVLVAAAHAVGWPLPRGGSQRLSDSLAGYLRSIGGRVSINRRVETIKELVRQSPVVLDLSPRGVLSVARDLFPEGYRRRLAKYRYGPGTFKIDWALSGPIPWEAPECREAGTVHLGGTLDEIAASEWAVAAGAHPDRPFVLLAQQSLFDPSRAPEGKQTAWAYCHVPNGSMVDMTGAIEAQVERFAPGFRDLVLARHGRTATALEEYNPNCVGGDISGGRGDLRQIFFRPTVSLRPYRTPNPRVFLCSASTPPGGGVHGMCGYHAAQAVLRSV
jgi:phytoene dehydrogenase-like protein